MPLARLAATLVTTAVVALAPLAAGAVPVSAADAVRPFDADALVRLERVSDPRVSPNGRRVAYTLRTTDYEANQGLQAVQGLQMVRFAQETLPGPEVCAALLQRLAQGPQTVQDLLDGTPPVRQHLVLRGMAWLVKLGILRASPLE